MATPHTSKPEKVLRAREVARHLGCTDDTVYQLVRTGELRAIRVGRLIRVPASALADYIGRGAK